MPNAQPEKLQRIANLTEQIQQIGTALPNCEGPDCETRSMTMQAIVSEANAFILQAAEYSEPTKLVGNDIANFLAKLKEWAEAMNLIGLTKEALHALYHYVRDTLAPALLDSLPTYGKLLVQTVVFPILDKIHDAMGWVDVV